MAGVIDLFSRRGVGWSMNASMTAQLVTDALIMANWRSGKPDALLHHLGSGQPIYERAVSTSHDRSRHHLLDEPLWKCLGQCRDGELFSSLKTESTARKVYRTRNDVRADVFAYIERFYNPKDDTRHRAVSASTTLKPRWD